MRLYDNQKKEPVKGDFNEKQLSVLRALKLYPGRYTELTKAPELRKSKSVKDK